MKSSIRHGGKVCCDMVFVDRDENWKNECRETFVSYSVSSIVRIQAANAGWSRVKAKFVKWPGLPPMGPGKRADLCPDHGKLVMTDEEYKKSKDEAKAKKKAERDELKKVIAKDKREAKAAKKRAEVARATALKKPKVKRARKKKAAEATA